MAAGSGIPDGVAKQLLSDPTVQQAIKAQGQDAAKALQDPMVQQQILDTCKERFPEYAAVAQAKITEFCKDPAVQQKAREYGVLAMQYVGQSAGLLVAQIEQGPAGVRLLAFIGGIASCALAMLSIINPFGILSDPVTYVISVYQLCFSLTTILFEAKPEWIQKVSGVDKYQDMLIDKAQFMAETLGRGLFYVFQGTLWLSLAGMTELLYIACGIYMVFIGVLNILMHYGGYQLFAEKVSKGYKSLKESA